MQGEREEESVAGPPRATVDLEPEERPRVGLRNLPLPQRRQPDTALAVGALPPLDEEQWADPGVAAARFALVRSNYRATEDAAVVRARSAPVRRLQEDLASSSGGEAALAELRAKGTAFTGDVVGLVTSERSQDPALVDLRIQRFFVNGNALDPERIVVWRVTLVRDRLTGHWQVTDLQLS